MNRSTDLKGAHGTKTMLDLERASQISKGATQKQPDAWSEGVPLPLAFESYATKVYKGVLFSMVLESGTRKAVKPGCFAIRRDQNLSTAPNQQLFIEGATSETT